MSTHGLAKTLIAGAAFTVFGAVVPAVAQQTPRHIRGTIESVQDHAVALKTTRGAMDELALADDAKVFTVAPADMSAVRDGKFVGITSVDKDGKAVAVEVHVFDDSLRGLGEGHYPWDLDASPNMMTNATIARVESIGGDRVLKLDYKGGTQEIEVPPSATVVEFTPGTPEELKPGAQVFVVARPQPDGELMAAAIVVGKDGLKPPM